jgi:hypothetical protein
MHIQELLAAMVEDLKTSRSRNVAFRLRIWNEGEGIFWYDGDEQTKFQNIGEGAEKISGMCRGAAESEILSDS